MLGLSYATPHLSIKQNKNTLYNLSRTEGICNSRKRGGGEKGNGGKMKQAHGENLGLYSRRKFIWKNENCRGKPEPSDNNKAISPH